jgi:hypothetical protein
VSTPNGAPGCGSDVDVCEIGGDLNDDSATNVTDVQCGIIVSLWVQADDGSPMPECMAWPAGALDMNCDAQVNVTDLVLLIQGALGAPLDPSIDGDGDGCADACQVP